MLGQWHMQVRRCPPPQSGKVWVRQCRQQGKLRSWQSLPWAGIHRTFAAAQAGRHDRFDKQMILSGRLRTWMLLCQRHIQPQNCEADLGIFCWSS